MAATLDDKLRNYARLLDRRTTSALIEADDLLQEARCALMLEGPFEEEALAYTCGKRRMLDYCRKVLGRTEGTRHGERNSLTVLDEWSERKRQWNTRSSPSAEEDALGGHLGIGEVVDLLGRLPRNMQDVALAEWRGETLRQVGARYGVTESRACQVRTAAREILRRRVDALART